MTLTGARTFTAAEMLEQARLTQVFAEWALSHWYPGAPVSVDEANGLKLSAAMLRQGAEAESRWERLRAEASDDYDSVESSNVGDTILHIMARLEKERTA